MLGPDPGVTQELRLLLGPHQGGAGRCGEPLEHDSERTGGTYHGPVPMRKDCRHYETRTYSAGETVHMCRLDLAPEAPWRCPEECAKFERRAFDAGWTHGSLAHKPAPVEPPRLDADTAALLDHAEDIINAVGPDIVSEIERHRMEQSQAEPRWKRLFRRRRTTPGGDDRS